MLEAIAKDATIYEAWSDEAWTVEGAAVRVSLVCFVKDTAMPLRLNGSAVASIHANLSAGPTDLTTARRLSENQSAGFLGAMKKAPFDISGDLARSWLREPANPNGLPNSAVLRPWANGDDLLGRPSGRWIVDFASMEEADAAMFALPFAHVAHTVKPKRILSGSVGERRYWWRLARRAPAMLDATQLLPRFIATPRVAKYRLFVWCEPPIIPDGQLVVIARDDDAAFGILHSRFHEAWSLRLGTSLEDRPRYTPTTTFETFPFPKGLTPNLPAASYATDPRAIAIADAARALVEARDRWLNPPEWVERVPEVVPGFPDRIIPRNEAAARSLKARTLTNLYNTRGTPEGAWLDGLHRRLDAAVAAAYGWPEDITTDEALARLLALNLARAKAGDSA